MPDNVIPLPQPKGDVVDREDWSAGDCRLCRHAAQLTRSATRLRTIGYSVLADRLDHQAAGIGPHARHDAFAIAADILLTGGR